MKKRKYTWYFEYYIRYSDSAMSHRNDYKNDRNKFRRYTISGSSISFFIQTLCIQKFLLMYVYCHGMLTDGEKRK